jgi:hypothetical protein
MCGWRGDCGAEQAEEATKPAHLRRALPLEPPVGASGGPPMSLAQQNEVASQVFNQHMLARCEHCGRTFLPEK